MARLPIGLCQWGLTYSLGVMGRGTPRQNPHPMTGLAFLELAARLQCSRAEVSLDIAAPDGSPARLDEFRARAEDLKLALTVSGGKLAGAEVAQLIPVLEAAARLGARRVRFIVSSLLCGDRRAVGGLTGWRRLLEGVARTLKHLAPEAATRGLRLAVENHQDTSSADLVWLCEAVGHPAMGLTMDTGNPLAVGEDIPAFARRVLPHLVNVHLKDYRVHPTPDGYLLARCALGEGVVPFPELLGLFSSTKASLHAETAALTGRPIRAREPDYWQNLGAPGTPDENHPVMRLLRDRPANGDPQTPWERGEDADLPAYELAQTEQSIRYLTKVLERRTV